MRRLDLQGQPQSRAVRNLRVYGGDRCVGAGGEFAFQILNEKGNVKATVSLDAEQLQLLGDFLFLDPAGDP